MTRRGGKEPLYRKVNTRTHGVHHGSGQRAAYERHSKGSVQDKSARGSMHSGQRHGLDYTPLFRFLLSRVGEDWNKVHSEAVARLDREDPVWWLVARTPDDEKAIVRCGESAYFSGLRVGRDGRLEKVAPDLAVGDLNPSCPCCTHTFNGARFTRPYRSEASQLLDLVDP